MSVFSDATQTTLCVLQVPIFDEVKYQLSEIEYLNPLTDVG
jgi:hypothetical protein